MMKWFWILAVVLGGGDERFAELSEALESKHGATRRVAVRELAELGTPEAWGLVLSRLADPEGEVADEAQWQLARGRVTARLLGREGLRARDPWVRLRAAELLGRCEGPLDGRALVRHLSRREPQVSAAIAWSLERLARAGALGGDAVRVAREVRRAVSFGGQAGAAALACLEALEGDGLEEELVRASRSGDVLLRAAAAEVSSRRDGPKDWTRVELLAEDEDAGVRRVLIDALDLEVDRKGALLCAERLGLEEVPTIRAQLLRHLRSWSGLRHRFDPRPWRDWASSLALDWTPQVISEPVSLPAATTTFAGITVRSNHLSVLVDFSGSIHTALKDGLTRRDYVELELERLLMALPAHARFNVIAFCDEAHAWREELSLNRRGEAVEALEWFRKLGVRGKGDFFAAAELALEDPDVDTLLVFTDGVPTGGRRFKLELMALLLDQECRFRGVSVDSVLVGASRRTSRAWREIAALTGGESMELEITRGPEGAGGG